MPRVADQMLGESFVDRASLIPVIQSFRELALMHYGENNPHDGQMGQAAYCLQVDKAAVEFQERLRGMIEDIGEKLKAGLYAPQSAGNPQESPIDQAERERDEKLLANQ